MIRATQDFQRLRKDTHLNAEKGKLAKAIAEFATENPDLAFMASDNYGADVPDASKDSTFIADVAFKLRKYGSLSVNQIAAVRRSLAQNVEWAASLMMPRLKHSG